MNNHKLVFMDGCFDDFEGTQEELDELVESIKKMFEDGTIMEKAIPLELDELEDVREMFAKKEARQ